MQKLGIYNESVEIDDELKNLVQIMNLLKWIETTSCCIGHENHPYHPAFYLQFFCESKKIKNLAKILNNVQDEMITTKVPAFLECNLVYHADIGGGQFDAPEGAIAFELRLKEWDDKRKLDMNDKLNIVDSLTEKFRKYTRSK